ncbi:nuclear transport factor 2 family protein [Streptomonospora sp. NEAU-YY374]|nr:nuclear transport factor 2 family protein [Streptomonospora nanhaiensis]
MVYRWHSQHWPHHQGVSVSTTLTADRAEVAELFARLADLLDARRPDDARTVYHDDIVVHSPRGGELRGLAEVTGFLKSALTGEELTQHVHGDVLVHLDGDRATAAANQLVYFYRDGEPPHRTGGLRVACGAARTPEGWRFTEMRITPAWTREH